MKKRATLKDVALYAGVAVSTVSGIINNRSDSWASKATRKRVFDAARELDFTPNRLARGLRLDSFELVLLMVPDLTNPLFANLTRKIRHTLEERGYEIIIEETEFDAAREFKVIENLPNRMVDGCICVLSNPSEMRPVLEKVASRVPIVVIGDRMVGLPLDTLESEFAAGLESVVNHLSELGHSRLGFVDSMEGVRDPLTRLDSFRSVLERYGMEMQDAWVVQSPPDLDTVQENVRQWSRNLSGESGPTALFCLNDVTAIAALRGLQDAGIKVPSEMSVVGFDNIVLSGLIDCPLTTVHQPLRRLAQRSCTLLMDRINGAVSGPGSHEILPTHLVVRQSTSRVPVASRAD